ncbi:MAG TPA: hypothetical protein VIF09_03220 [Polyangiaceae bacterium]
MNYRAAGDARFFLCASCMSPEQGPPQGGPAACSRCRTQVTLPDRSAMLANPGLVPPPDNDPNRLAQLRLQDGRPRVAAPTLAAVLGGQGIQPGREQEALAIWNSLRMRAQQGDVSASEDLATLTLMVAQLDSSQQQPVLVKALAESGYDASVLPRHKQEHLGRLVRLAIKEGDRGRAQRYLSWMMPNAPELDADSEFRVSSAWAATMDRDAQRVFALLGPQKDAVPIVDWMDDMATVLRANAYEVMGNLPTAGQALGQLANPRALPAIRGAFPALALCQASGGAFEAASNQQAAGRAASSASMIGYIVGGILAFSGFVTLASGVGITVATGGEVLASIIPGSIGAVLLVVGIVIVVRARAKAKRAAWLRVNGVSLTARIVNAELTGTMINNVPLMRFVLQVAGPHGPYAASFKKLAPAHEVARVIGGEVRVRADPNNMQDVILED